MNLTCVHGPSKQLGKRPRRRLDLGPGPFERSEPSANAHSANRSPAIEDLAATEEEHHSIYDQCPILGIGIMPPEDIQLSLPSEPSIVWPLLDNGLLGSRHRCYHESNEVMQLLSIPENLFPDDAPTVLEVSQILQANRRAIESINRLVSCNCAKTRGHQALLYASLISRTLFWYREAAADEIYQPKNIMGVLSPNTSSGSLTPPSALFPRNDISKCVEIKASAITVGGFDIDDPQMQRAFRNQLIRHELKNVDDLIEKYSELAFDENVQESDKILFVTLGTWLRADLEQAMAVVADGTKHIEKD